METSETRGFLEEGVIFIFTFFQSLAMAQVKRYGSIVPVF
jgi:hypothetical protein